jgi:hypothetical protein
VGPSSAPELDRARAALRPAPARPRAAPGAPRARGPRRPDRRDVLLLAPLLVLYLAVCALAQPGADPVRDEPDLLAAAARMLDGRLVPGGPLPDPRAYLWHGPGLVALLAPLVALDLPLPVIRFIEPVLLAGAMLVFHRLLRARLQRRAALAWTYALGLYVPFLSVVPQVHKEPLSILLVVAGMLALTRALAGGGWRYTVAAGLALAGLAMVRLEYGWVAIGLLVLAAATWAVRRHSPVARRLAAVGAVAVAGCLPWLAYTQHLTGEPLYWGTSSGLSLFWLSPTLPGETGQWHAPGTVARDPALAPLRPLFDRLEGLHPVESDRVLRERARENIRARPDLYVRNLAANVPRLLFSEPMRPGITPLGVAVYAAFNALLLAATGWAAAILWRRRRVVAPETAPIAAFAVLAVAVHLLASASPRMLLPIVPALVWLAAQAHAARGLPRSVGDGRADAAPGSGTAARRADVEAGQGPRQPQ